MTESHLIGFLSHVGVPDSFWIGLTKLSNGYYYWFGSVKPVKFSNYAAIFNPNNNNYCIYMFGSDLQWDDASCENLNYFVCESDISQ